MSEDWEDDWERPEVIREMWQQGMYRRLHADMIEVLDRKLNEPIGAQNYTEEWVNEALVDELREANAKIERQQALLKTAGARIDEAKPYMTSLLSPPPPWKEFGYHANMKPVPDVEFWGEDGTGLPIWERRLLNRNELAEEFARQRRVHDRTDKEYGGQPPLAKDFAAADMFIAYTKGEV